MDQDDLRHSEPYHSQTAYTQPVSVEQAYPNAARHATYPAHIPTLNHQYERGANPRNAHGTKLKPVSVLRKPPPSTLIAFHHRHTLSRPVPRLLQIRRL